MISWSLASVACLLAASRADAAAPDPIQSPGVRILSIATNQPSLQVFSETQPKITLVVKSFGVGDVADVVYGKEKDTEPDTLKDILVSVQYPGRRAVVLSLGIAGAALLAITWLLLRSSVAVLVVGADNRCSKSKFQMVLWFFVLLSSYLAFTGLRGVYAGLDFVDGVGLQQNLLVLSTLSALSFAGSKAITQSRVDALVKDPVRLAAAMQAATVSTSTDAMTAKKVESTAQPRFPYDLVHDDEGRVDLADFQEVVITLIAAAVYVVTIFSFLASIQLQRIVSLPDVDGTMLAAFGVGQRAYLAKKLVGDGGGGKPAIPQNLTPAGAQNSTPAA